MAGPGDFLDPSMWPLFMQSGMYEQPPYLPPVGIDTMSPNERAAYQMRRAPQPNPQPVQTPEELGMSALQAAPMLMPGIGGMATRAVAAAPKTLASVLGIGGATVAASDAGEQTFNWSDPNKPRVERLGIIEREIEKEATRKTPSAPGTQKARMEGLNAEKNQLLQDRTAEYNDAFSRWQAVQEQARASDEARRRAETSLFDLVPGTRQAITAGAPIASYLGGRYVFGNRLPLGKAMIGGGLSGAAEGAASQYYPNEMDIGLPPSSPAHQEAIRNASSPDYWTRLGLATGGGALAGMMGASHGHMARRAPLPMIGGPGSGPGTPPAALSPAGPLPTIPGAAGTSPAGALPTGPLSPVLSPATSLPPANVYFDGKRWRDRTTGNFARRPPDAPPPLMDVE